MKKYVITVRNFSKPEHEEVLVIIAKNLQSAAARLSQGGFYSEDDILTIEISKH